MKKIFERNIEQFLVRIALSSYLDSPTVKEWKVAIYALSVIKGLTMALSVFAASMFVYNMALQVVNWPWLAGISTAVILLAIEVLNAMFLGKMFKNFLKGRWQIGFGLALVVGIVYFLSFYTSTNGLAERQAELVNQEVKISKDYNSVSESVKKGYGQRIAEVDESIKTVKTNPQLWKQGSRVDLSSDQLKQIQEYNRMKMTLLSEMNSELEKVEKAKRENLKENRTNTNNEASKYFNIVASVMLIQLLVNFGLVFFWAKISEEEKPEELNKESVVEFAQKLNDGTDDLIIYTLTKKLDYFKEAVDNISPSRSLPLPTNLEPNNDADQAVDRQTTNDRITVSGFGNSRSTAADRPTTKEEIEEAELVAMNIDPDKRYIVTMVRKVLGGPINREVLKQYGVNRLAHEIEQVGKHRQTTVKGVFDQIITFDQSVTKGGTK